MSEWEANFVVQTSSHLLITMHIVSCTLHIVHIVSWADENNKIADYHYDGLFCGELTSHISVITDQSPQLSWWIWDRPFPPAPPFPIPRPSAARRADGRELWPRLLVSRNQDVLNIGPTKIGQGQFEYLSLMSSRTCMTLSVILRPCPSPGMDCFFSCELNVKHFPIVVIKELKLWEHRLGSVYWWLHHLKKTQYFDEKI